MARQRVYHKGREVFGGKIFRCALTHPAEPPSARTPASVRAYRQDKRYGTDLEDRAVVAFASGGVPEWFRGVRPRDSDAQDHAGVDLWVTTDIGDVAVQVKSSAARAKEFRNRVQLQHSFAIVVLHEAMSDEEIRQRVLDGVAAARRARAWWSRRGRGESQRAGGAG